MLEKFVQTTKRDFVTHKNWEHQSNDSKKDTNQQASNFLASFRELKNNNFVPILRIQYKRLQNNERESEKNDEMEINKCMH